MRRLLLVFIVLVVIAGAVVLSLSRGKPQTLGDKLLGALEGKKGAMRGAIQLMDYSADAGAVQAARDEKVQRGAEGGDFARKYGQQWVRGKTMEFVWRVMRKDHAEDVPLRAAIAAESPARGDVVEALGKAGVMQDGARTILEEATKALDSLSDEDLFLAWLRADRGVMGQSEDFPRAAREGLLLVARENAGPAIVFVSGKQRVYLLPIDGAATSESGTVWAQMEAYEDGRLQWTGVLRMDGSPGADRVRQMAVRMAEEAVRPAAW